MSAPLPRRRFHNRSVFGDGRRTPLDRNARARFIWLIRQDRRAGRISATGEDVGLQLVKMLGEDGRLDPSHETLRERVGCRAASTIREQLNRLRDLGRLTWERRLRRDPGTGWRAEQTSNAYILLPNSCDAGLPRGVRSDCTRQTADASKNGVQQAIRVPTEAQRTEAQRALDARVAVMTARLRVAAMMAT
jgi:hypothetical protein